MHPVSPDRTSDDRTIDLSSNADAFSSMRFCSCRVYLISMRCTGASHVDETHPHTGEDTIFSCVVAEAVRVLPSGSWDGAVAAAAAAASASAATEQRPSALTLWIDVWGYLYTCCVPPKAFTRFQFRVPIETWRHVFP